MGGNLTQITRGCAPPEECPADGNLREIVDSAKKYTKCCDTDHCNMDMNSAMRMVHSVAILLTGCLLASVLPY